MITPELDMKQSIEQIKLIQEYLTAELEVVPPRKPYEYDSPELTRQVFIQSEYLTILTHLEAAVKHMELLKYHFY